MGALFERLSQDQLEMLRVIVSAARREGQWPHFQYVSFQLEDQGIDPTSVVRSFQSVQPYRYGPLWTDTLGIDPYAQTRLGVTIAGLAQLPEETDVVETFLRVVDALHQRWRRFQPDPIVVSSPSLSNSELAEIVQEATGRADPTDLVFIEMLMEHEPSLWGGGRSGMLGGEWTMQLPDQIRRFGGVHSIDAYLARLETFFLESMPRWPGGGGTLANANASTDELAGSGWRARHEQWLNNARRVALAILIAAVTGVIGNAAWGVLTDAVGGR